MKDIYNDDITQRLLSAPADYLNKSAQELYDKSWLYRYYNDLSWIYGVTDQELTDFKLIYDSSIKDLQNRPRLENKPLTNKKIKQALELFPKFDERQYILDNFGKTMLRGLLAYFIFPYGVYLMFKTIKKTRQFRNLLNEIILNSKTIRDTLNTDNIEEWLELQAQTKNNNR